MNKELNQSQRKALGKGLSALLPGKGSGKPSSDSAASQSSRGERSEPAKPLPESFQSFQSIPVEAIKRNEKQPRVNFDEERLEELAQSIRANGIIQPITVTPVGEGTYQIVAGERRYRAAILAGLATVPALVRSTEQDKRLELALIENIQREDLNPIETALAFSSLIDQLSLSHEQVAERTGKERSTITNFLRLLKLPVEIQTDLEKGEISMGHARALLSLPTVQAQKDACQQILDRQLSVRETEKLVKLLISTEPAAKNGSGKKLAETPDPDANVRAALQELQSALGTKVRLTPKPNGGGKIEIEYYSADDLDRIYSLIVHN